MTATTLRFGVLGEHLPHTLSPEIHRTLFAKQHIQAEYRIYEWTPKEVQELRPHMESAGLTGLNVTIPYKETVLPLLDDLDPHAQAIGAVNTLLLQKGRLLGYNTDFTGVLAMFSRAGVSLAGRHVVILGSGGAAKALLYAFHRAGAAQVTVAARNGKERERLCRRFPFLSSSSLEDIPSGDILVNATPVGMYPRTGESPVDASVLARFSVAADIVYNPLQTEFLRIAQAQGLKTVTGLMMLVEQAVAAQEIWFCRQADPSWALEIHDTLAKRFI